MRPLYVHITMTTDGVPDDLTLCGKSAPKVAIGTPRLACGKCVVAYVEISDRNADLIGNIVDLLRGESA